MRDFTGVDSRAKGILPGVDPQQDGPTGWERDARPASDTKFPYWLTVVIAALVIAMLSSGPWFHREGD